MDNLTHSLIGWAAAKAGLERLSPYAAPLCIIAANAPDADILTAFAGSSTYLHHHRGITHSIIGTIALALALPLIFYGGDMLIARLRHRAPRSSLKGLLLASLVTSLSHPLLDWTNNYGVRPLLPWKHDWYYGDLVFIIDPWLWLSLGGACFLLTSSRRWQKIIWALFALVITLALFNLPARAGYAYPLASRALWVAGLLGLICAQRLWFETSERPRNAPALIALGLVVAYWGLLSLFHQQALVKVRDYARTLNAGNDVAENHLAAMPTLGNPLRWQAIVDTEAATYRFDLSLADPQGQLRPNDLERFIKPTGDDTRMIKAAARDKRAAAFLEFSRFPAAAVTFDCAGRTLVEFADLRYTEPHERRGSFNVVVGLDATAKDTDK